MFMCFYGISDCFELFCFVIVSVGLEYDGPIEECLIDQDERYQCGDQTDSDACLAAGCCWSPTDDVQIPDCYQPVPSKYVLDK